MGNSKKELRDLWRRSFGDTEAYMDYYFSQKAPASDIYTGNEGGMLASMAFLRLIRLNYLGQIRRHIILWEWQQKKNTGGSTG